MEKARQYPAVRPLNLHKAPLLATHNAVVAWATSCGLRGDVFHLLEHVSEQAADSYVVMVDGTNIVSFEVDRDGMELSEVEHQTVKNYRRNVRGHKAKELLAALREVETLQGNERQ